MFKKNRGLLILFLLYCIDSIRKIAHWQSYAKDGTWWGIALALSVRFAFMTGLLWFYLRANGNSSKVSGAKSGSG